MGFKPRLVLPTFRLAPSVVVRPCRRDDADELFDVVDANRAHLRQWLSWLDHTRSSRDTAGFLQESHRLHLSGGGLRMLIVVADRIAGTVSIEAINRMHRHAQIGYWLAERYQGRGYVTRAVKALCDHGFDYLDLHRLEIRCAPGNLRSRAIPERLGFTREGQCRDYEWLYNHFVDHVVYAMIASNWNQLN